LGEDESQPDDHHASETQARPIAVGREVLVYQGVHTHLFELREDDRDIVYSLVLDCNLFAHPTSVSQFSFSRDYSRERSACRYGIRCFIGLLQWDLSNPLYRYFLGAAVITFCY